MLVLNLILTLCDSVCVCVTVEDGGNLDIRSVAVTRAPGRTIPGVNGYGDLRLIMGGSVLIQPGGNFHGRGYVSCSHDKGSREGRGSLGGRAVGAGERVGAWSF